MYIKNNYTSIFFLEKYFIEYANTFLFLKKKKSKTTLIRPRRVESHIAIAPDKIIKYTRTGK